MGKVRLTDVVKREDILRWKPGDNVLLAAPMGAGKSYLCKNVLYDIAKSVNGKILMLIHRSNCVEQFKYEIEADGKSDVIHVITYQSLEYSKLHNTNKISLSDYMFVVSDEFHYFFNDSSFNNKTAISFNMIMGNTSAIHVFMSATGDHMARYMKKYIKDNGLEDAIEYEIPFDFSFIKQLTFFHKDSTMEEFLKEGIESGAKGIFFIQSAEKAYKLYIKIINNQKLAGLKRSMEQKIEMADYYMDTGYSVSKLIEKYPMQNDINNILYDELLYDENGNVIPNSYTKKINEPMYFKKKEDIADYSIMLQKFGKFGYCKYLALMFGFYDSDTGRCTYRMINEEYDLESYLEKMVNDDVVMLQLRDRSELINKINAKQDGKLLKSANTLNSVLEEREINYRIKTFATTRYPIDDNGIKKKKKYKNAWKIVRF